MKEDAGLYYLARHQDLWRQARGHVGAVSALTRQRGRYLGTRAYDTEMCYLDTMGHGADQNVQNDIKSFRNLNVIFFLKKRLKYEKFGILTPRTPQ